MKYVADDLAARLGTGIRRRRKGHHDEEEEHNNGVDDNPADHEGSVSGKKQTFNEQGSLHQGGDKQAATFGNSYEEEIDHLMEETRFIKKEKERNKSIMTGDTELSLSWSYWRRRISDSITSCFPDWPDSIVSRIHILWPCLDHHTLIEIVVLSFLLVLAIRPFLFSSERSLYWGSKVRGRWGK